MNRVADYVQPTADASSLKLHNSLFVADLHADTLLWDRDVLDHAERGHVDIPRMREGNVALQVFTTVTKSPSGLNYVENDASTSDMITLLAILQTWPIKSWSDLTERALFQASKLHNAADRAPDQLQLVLSKSDLQRLVDRRTAGERVVGGLLGTEGSHALSGELSNIDVLYDAGFRMMSLQHFFDNKLGGSFHGTSNAGLTKFGADAIKKNAGITHHSRSSPLFPSGCTRRPHDHRSTCYHQSHRL